MCLVRVCLPPPDHKFHEGRDLFLVSHKPPVAGTVLATLYAVSQCLVDEHVKTKSPGYGGTESGVTGGW